MKLRNKTMIILVAFMLLFATAGCEKAAPEATQEPTAEVIATEAPEVADTTVYAINEEGGYMIALPEDWNGKVTFTSEGTTTVFSHVTSDAAAAEQNPVLATVDMVAVGEEYVGEVILETAENVFYMTIALDLPYEAESADAIEFTALSEQTAEVLNTLVLTASTEATDEVEATDAPEATDEVAATDAPEATDEAEATEAPATVG